MTGKELVPRNRPGALDTLEEQSPCPMFDQAVQSVLLDVHATATTPEIPPHERDAHRTVQEGRLRRLIEKVEAGRWSETVPGPMPEPEDWPLLSEQKSILQLIDDPEAFDRLWDEMSWAQKTSWVTDRSARR